MWQNGWCTISHPLQPESFEKKCSQILQENSICSQIISEWPLQSRIKDKVIWWSISEFLPFLIGNSIPYWIEILLSVSEKVSLLCLSSRRLWFSYYSKASALLQVGPDVYHHWSQAAWIPNSLLIRRIDKKAIFLGILAVLPCRFEAAEVEGTTQHQEMSTADGSHLSRGARYVTDFNWWLSKA